MVATAALASASEAHVRTCTRQVCRGATQGKGLAFQVKRTTGTSAPASCLLTGLEQIPVSGNACGKYSSSPRCCHTHSRVISGLKDAMTAKAGVSCVSSSKE